MAYSLRTALSTRFIFRPGLALGSGRTLIHRAGAGTIRGLRYIRKPPQKRFHAQGLYEFICFFRIWTGERGIFIVKIHRRVLTDPGKLQAEKGKLFVRLKIFLRSRWFHLIQAFIHTIYAVICLNKGSSRLLTYAGHTGNIVRRVAHKCLKLDEFLRRDTIGLLHIVREIILIYCLSFFSLGYADTHLFGSQLQQIAVAG